jgi:SAM-dependent methyltransferase
VEEAAIQAFWESHPCGDHLIGGLNEDFRGDYDAFFDAYDRFRYLVESHIPACLDALGVQGQRVLEIGLGEGTESEQLIRRGANWSGLDITRESVSRVETRLTTRELPYDNLWLGSVTKIPATDSTFDLVFSHGILHHVPEVVLAQREIHRILRPGGRLIVMLYAKRSLNYQVSIRVLRRTVLLGLWPFRRHVSVPGVSDHLQAAEREGLFHYLKMSRFLHANTDGPQNPYSKVYNKRDVTRDFPDFSVQRLHKHFVHAPPLPVHSLPGASVMGWHLWVEMVAR